MKLIQTFLLFALYLPLTLMATELESDLLKPIVGDRGESIGAEVIDVTKENETTTIELKVPVDDLENYQAEIVIEGNKSSKNATVIQSPQRIYDQQSEEVGLRFTVKGLSKFQFKVQLKESDPEDKLKTQ